MHNPGEPMHVRMEGRKMTIGRYQVIDLGSHNGTYVNGVRVDQAELNDGDIIAIGHATFRLAEGELVEDVADDVRPD
jgi:ABC transport system ATP-binding/permease protein